MYRFTVFTPTFNRAGTLFRVFDSLTAQTFRNFEWIIVDDGSYDETKDIVNSFRSKANFPIVYFYQENQGMLVGVKKGLELAKGEFFLKADSDDSFVPQTLEIFNKVWCSIPENRVQKYAGVTCLVFEKSGKIIGDPFPEDVFDSSRAEISYVHKIKGEKWGFHKTDIMRKYRIPDEDGRFYAMGLLISEIGKDYQTRYINKALRCYYHDGNNQISKFSPKKNSGRWYTYALGINSDFYYFRFAPFMFWKLAAIGVRLALHHKVSLMAQLDRLSGLGSKLLWLTALPIGVILYLIDSIKLMLQNYFSKG